MKDQEVSFMTVGKLEDPKKTCPKKYELETKCTYGARLCIESKLIRV